MNNMSLSYCMSEAFNGAPKKNFLKKQVLPQNELNRIVIVWNV